jgi:hypothetical protein
MCYEDFNRAKKGFSLVDNAEPDFELLALKFDQNAISPKFQTNMIKNKGRYAKGVTIICSAQCPYSEKNVVSIMETARKKYGLTPRLVELDDSDAVQNAPCAFGTFCVIFNGEIISYHPISNKRFENIMEKIRK